MISSPYGKSGNISAQSAASRQALASMQINQGSGMGDVLKTVAELGKMLGENGKNNNKTSKTAVKGNMTDEQATEATRIDNEKNEKTKPETDTATKVGYVVKFYNPKTKK